MVWYVRDAQLKDLITPGEANQVIEELFANEANGQVITRPTLNVPLKGKSRLTLKAAADYANGTYGFKAYPAPGKHVGSWLTVLYDIEGGLQAIVEGEILTRFRTGAVAAVGTKYMARPDASTLGIIGTGKEARHQLLATTLVRDFKTDETWVITRSDVIQSLA